MAASVGVWSPIIFLPMVFQGAEGGSEEAYGPGLGKESLPGSPSSITMWRRLEGARLVGRAGDDGMALLGVVPRGGGVAGSFARIVVRVTTTSSV